MSTVVQDVSGDSSLQTAIAVLKAKIEAAEESSEIAQAVSEINTALGKKQDKLTFDSTPTAGSTKPVTSGGIKTALNGKQDKLTFDSTPTAGSTKPVTSGGIKTALDGKQNTLIFDNEPTAASTKPVTSGGVKEALDDMYSEISDRMAAAKEDIDIRGGAIYESASGSLVEITDGGDNLPMKSAVVTMEPIQDLHGYDNPWPAGGGVNLLDPNIKFTEGTYYGLTLSTTNGYIYTLTGTATGSGNLTTTSVASQDADIFPAGTYYSKGGTFSLYRPDGTWIRNQSSNVAFTVDEPFFVANVYLEIVSGRTYNTNDFIAIVKGSTAPTEWTPYSNICPISGRTGLSVVRAGVNVWDEETEYGYYSAVNGQVGSYIITQLRSKNYISVKPSTSYCFKKPITLGDILFYDANKSYISILLNVDSNHVFTTPGNCYYIRLNLGSTYGNTYNHDIGLNYPATNIEYHSYKGNTYSVNWETEAGTVYGGSLDVVSGKLVVDRAIIDLGNLSWNYEASVPCFYSTGINTVVKKVNNNSVANCVSSMFKAASFDDLYLYSKRNGTMCVNDAGTFSVINNAYSDPVSFRTAMSGVQLVCELATPTEIQLTPQEIRTLLGVNNIWSDGGDMAVEYPADTKSYIDNKIAEAIAAAMA